MIEYVTNLTEYKKEGKVKGKVKFKNKIPSLPIIRTLLTRLTAKKIKKMKLKAHK